MNYFLIYWKVISLPTNKVFNYSRCPLYKSIEGTTRNEMYSNINNYHSNLITWVSFFSNWSAFRCLCTRRVHACTLTDSLSPQVRQDPRPPSQRGGPVYPARNGCHPLWVWCLSFAAPLSWLDEALPHLLVNVPFHNLRSFKMPLSLQYFIFWRLPDGCGVPL